MNDKVMITTEPSVEQWMSELREMFPELIAGQLAIVEMGYSIAVGKRQFYGRTLSEAMSKVRAYYARQSTPDRKVKRQ